MGPGISKFTYSVLGIIGQVTGILGSFWYERNLKHVEVRTILFWGLPVSIVSSFCSYIFAKRWNLEVGISDMVFIVLTNTVFGVVALAMNILPTLALFARITPKGIEGTIFAFLTGTFNLANQVFSPMVGAWINNNFVGVTAEDLTGYATLQLISFGLCFTAFPLQYLIPLKSDIERWQKERLSGVEPDK